MDETHEQRKARIGRERESRKAEKAARKRQKKERADARRGIDRSIMESSSMDCSSLVSPAVCVPSRPSRPPASTAPPSSSLKPGQTNATHHNVGVIGCGSWFFLKAHVPHLSKLHINGTIQISALYSPSQSSVEKCLKQLKRHNVSPSPPIPTFFASSPPTPTFFTNLHTVILTVPPDTLPSYFRYLSNSYPEISIITEKPALPSLSDLPPSFLPHLMYTRRSNIAVLENWILKPSYVKFRSTVFSSIMTHGTPISYTLTLSQERSSSSWRSSPSSPLRDVGVHVVRMLRDLFGEFAAFPTSSSSATSSSTSLNATSTHSLYPTLQGSISLLFTPDLPPSSQCANLTINFSSPATLTYNIASDGWITGGVSATLNEALRFVKNVPSKKGVTSSKMSFEEGLRDVAVLDVLLSNPPSTPPSTLPNRNPIFLQSSPPRYANTTDTNSRTFSHVVRCSSASDVLLAMEKARESASLIVPVGAENSMLAPLPSIPPHPPTFRIETSMMDRVLSLDLPLDSTSSPPTITVQPSLSLRNLTSLLSDHNYMLPSLPILLDQTVAGCVSTGSHGSSLHEGTISDRITAMTLISPHYPAPLTYPHSDDSLPPFELARCALGKLGVITSLTLALTPLKKYVRSETIIPLSSFTSSALVELASSTSHCWVHWIGEVLVAISLTESDSPSALPYNGRNWYPFSSNLDDLLKKSSPPPSPSSKNYTFQHSIPLSHLDLLLHKVSEWKLSNPSFSKYPMELKFLPSSSLTLHAPNSTTTTTNTPFVCLNVWWNVPSPNTFSSLQSSLVAIPDGNVHFGKWHLPSMRPPFSPPTLQPSLPPTPQLSVIMPVYNAQPYLPEALLSVLSQTPPSAGGIELIVSDDCSSDGSYEYLQQLASVMPPSSVKVVYISSDSSATSLPPPALQLPPRQSADISSSSPLPSSIQALVTNPITPQELAKQVHPSNTLILVLQSERKNVGQGATMSRMLPHIRSPYTGFMESDDTRSPLNYQALLSHISLTQGYLDGVCCEAECVGWEREGMARYVEWQNTLLSTDDFRKFRFVEIPSLMQTLVLKTNVLRSCLHNGAFRDDLKWSIDYHFWLNFFSKKFLCARLPQNSPKFQWRQHPGQQTRRHGRLSIENLRSCKCEFLSRELVESKTIEVWSVGKTLGGWVDDLKSQCGDGTLVVAKEWNVSPFDISEWNPDLRPARLFAFGMDKMRKRVESIVNDKGGGWNDDLDFFVS